MSHLLVRKITITVSSKYHERVTDFLGILARDYQIIGDNILTTSKNPDQIDEEVELLKKLIRQYKNEYRLDDDFEPNITY